MFALKKNCNLPNVHGVMDGTHFSIIRHVSPFSEDYYYYKTMGYNLVYQAIIDDKKQFVNMFVGPPLGVWMIQKFLKDQVFTIIHNIMDSI